MRSSGAGRPSISSTRTACGNSARVVSGVVALSLISASIGEARRARVIVRASIAAAIGVANDVPSQAAQPPNSIAGSDGLGVAPWATIVLAVAKVDCRLEPRAIASTHGPKLL